MPTTKTVAVATYSDGYGRARVVTVGTDVIAVKRAVTAQETKLRRQHLRIPWLSHGGVAVKTVESGTILF